MLGHDLLDVLLLVVPEAILLLVVVLVIVVILVGVVILLPLGQMVMMWVVSPHSKQPLEFWDFFSCPSTTCASPKISLQARQSRRRECSHIAHRKQ
jgi:hypothetical protein